MRDLLLDDRLIQAVVCERPSEFWGVTENRHSK